MSPVVDDFLDPEAVHKAGLGRACRPHDFGAQHLGDLDRVASDATRGPVHQNALTGLQSPSVPQETLKRGAPRSGGGRGLLMADARGFGSHRVGLHGD